MRKQNIIFVGSFKSKSKSGHVGGQMFACRSLLESELSSNYNWLKIDSTAITNKKRSFISRTLKAGSRITCFIYYLIFKNPSKAVIFCSSGASFIEKGLMVRLGNWFGVESILAPRSGHLLDDISSSDKMKSFAKGVFKKAKYIICQGSFWKEFFSQELGVNEAKLVILPNWITVSTQRKNLKVHNGAFNVLVLGWVEENKGIYDILKAAKRMDGESVKWLFAGHGKEYEEFKAAVQHEKLDENIKLLGWVIGDEKKELFQKVDAMVLASYREGFPNVILESMQNGIPIISTNVGGIPDSISDGENGFLFEPGDVDSLVEKLNSLKQSPDLRSQFVAKAYEILKSRHSIENAVSVFKKLLDD